MPHLGTKTLWQQKLSEEPRTNNRDIRRANLHKIQFYGSTVSKTYDRYMVLYGSQCEFHVLNKAVTTFKSTRIEYTQRKEGKKRNDSITRARMQVYRIASSNVYAHGDYAPVFATLTFADNITDLSQAHIYFKAFTRRLSKKLGCRSKYIAVPEFQKRGAVHYHVIYFNLPWVDKVDFEKLLWRYGMARLKASTSSFDKDIQNVAAYMSKYMSKDMIDSRMYGRKLYFCSRGIFRPVFEYAQHIVDKMFISPIIKKVQLIELKYKQIFICKTLLPSPNVQTAHLLMRERENLLSMITSCFPTVFA